MDRVLVQLTGNLFPANKWLSAKLAVNSVRHPVTVAYCNLEEMSTNHELNSHYNKILFEIFAQWWLANLVKWLAFKKYIFNRNMKKNIWIEGEAAFENNIWSTAAQFVATMH